MRLMAVDEHAHTGVQHSRWHHYAAFVKARTELIAKRSSQGTLSGHLAAIAVPFGVAGAARANFGIGRGWPY